MITILAVYSLLLALVTGIPQLYYVLFALNRHAFPIAPDANPLGAVWYNYILGGHQSGYLSVESGWLAGAIEDAFMLARCTSSPASGCFGAVRGSSPSASSPAP